MGGIWAWVAFSAGIVLLLAVDLFVVHRNPHEVSTKEAALWSGVWIGLSLLFAAGIYLFAGHAKGVEFLTGYLIEKSLSVDNIFVFVVLFSYFEVPPKQQHRVLFIGVVGALVMRGAAIATGAWLLHHFDWITYVFGVFLVVTGARMALRKGGAMDPESSRGARLLQKLLPVSDSYEEGRFFTRSDTGRLHVTPLLVVLVLVEISDLIFAVDSIPAVFGVTRDTFIVYSSNALAILGLRSLYFLLADAVRKFHYLTIGVSIVLALVGLKMLLEEVLDVPTGVILGVIVAIIGASVGLSLWKPERNST
jgi:tellurite resistance protein TerC